MTDDGDVADAGGVVDLHRGMPPASLPELSIDGERASLAAAAAISPAVVFLSALVLMPVASVVLPS
jgi:hypothetical protein